MNSCLGNIQWSGLQLVLFLASYSWMLHASMVIQSTSFESIPFSFTLKILGLSPILSALAHQWSFVGAPVFVFVFFLSLRVKVVHIKRKVGGGGIWSLELPILCWRLRPQDHGVLLSVEVCLLQATTFCLIWPHGHDRTVEQKLVACNQTNANRVE